MTACLRCGRCCHYIIDGRIKKCKHLVKIKGKTLCRIYNKRLGQVIDKDSKGNKIICINREDSPIDYVDCPYNTNKVIVALKDN